MDDLARDIAERNASAERNEYLVRVPRQYYDYGETGSPVQRVPGKQPATVTIDVRVPWRDADGRTHWHGPYVTTLTIAECEAKPDALWLLLTRCLPFKEWKFVDQACGKFIHRLYNLEDGEGTQEEEEAAEAFWDGITERRKWLVQNTGGPELERIDHEWPQAEADMKLWLRGILTQRYGIIDSSRHRALRGSWWFVLSPIADKP
jgi:hypothetical protein